MAHRDSMCGHRSLSLDLRTRGGAGERLRRMKAWAPARLAFLSALLACAPGCTPPKPDQTTPPRAPETRQASSWRQCVPANTPFADLLFMGSQGPRVANRVHFSLSSMLDANDRRIDDARIERGALVSGAASPSLQLVGGSAGSRGEPWTGAKLDGAFGCTLDTTMEFPASARIVAATPHPTLPGAWNYHVEVQEPEPSEPGAERKFIPLCKGGEPALVVPGAWDKKGAHSNEKGVFSFACPNTAAAKCASPWTYHPGYADQNPQIPALYEACMRMVTADYCGEGASATEEATMVDVWDSARVLEPAPQQGFRFEAAWTRDGAVCMDHPRHPELFFMDSSRTPQRECLKKIPACHSPEEAQMRVLPGTPLLFNSSEVRSDVAK